MLHKDYFSCWIRPDYAFLALWLPLILILLTIPLYIILIARRWPNSGVSKRIYGPLTVAGELELYEAEKKERKAREKVKAMEKSDADSAERGKAKKPELEDIDAESEEQTKTENEREVLTNRTLARLLIPQIFLAVPLVSFFGLELARFPFH